MQNYSIFRKRKLFFCFWIAQDTWLLQRRPDDDENDKEAGTDNARGSDDVNHDGEGLSGHFGRALTI